MTDTVFGRRANAEDKAQVKQLWLQCFDDTPEFVRWYFERYYQPEHTLGLFAEEKILAAAQVIPYRIQLRGTALDCGYVVGVCTAPEARNRGYARTLLQECLHMQREHRQPVSLLMPFEGQFYYRYGWPFCYFHQQIEIAPKELRCAAKKWGTIRQAGLFEAADDLQRIYEVFAENYDGTVLRSAQNWQLLLEDAALEQTVCYLIERDGTAEGYCLWTPMEDKIFIREMAWCREDARAGLLDFLMKAVPENKRLRLELPDDDILVYQMAASKHAAVRYPFLMARIVDVKQCLETICYPAEEKAAFCMAVKDTFAAWNHGVFAIQIADGQASVTALEENRGNEADCTITIEALSQLVMGARSAEQLQRQNLLQTGKETAAVLQRLWPVQNLYINEYY